MDEKRNTANDKQLKVESVLENFTQKPKDPPKKKNNWVSMLFLLLIIGLGIYFMVQLATSVEDAEIRSLGDILAHIDVKYAVISVAVLFAVMLFEACKFSLITQATTGKFKLLNSIKVSFLGRYYDCITPFSSGGQPMQIYYLHKKGNSAGLSTAIVMIKYSFNMLCWVAICFVLMLANKDALTTYVTDPSQQKLFMIAGWIGWCINALLPFSIVFFAIFPKITNKILLFFINAITNCSWAAAKKKETRTGKSQLQRKIKILRRKEKWINSAHSAVKDFRSSFIIMSHKPLHFIGLILLCLSEQFLTWAFPYFILIAFANGSVAPSADIMFAIMTLNVYAAMSVSVIPTPGNSGVLENAVLVIFTMIATSAVFWVVFTWRFFTYYVYILIGLGITIFEVIRKAIRSKRQRDEERNAKS
ncbi:MAG: flippase-like domain-containing protein [Corallococcus sp.]|nr:flippase-like domain-containing protein [Corallococcus sp.]